MIEVFPFISPRDGPACHLQPNSRVRHICPSCSGVRLRPSPLLLPRSFGLSAACHPPRRGAIAARTAGQLKFVSSTICITPYCKTSSCRIYNVPVITHWRLQGIGLELGRRRPGRKTRVQHPGLGMAIRGDLCSGYPLHGPLFRGRCRRPAGSKRRFRFGRDFYRRLALPQANSLSQFGPCLSVIRSDHRQKLRPSFS
jgi:hypothetical protein